MSMGQKCSKFAIDPFNFYIAYSTVLISTSENRQVDR